ncbi:MAG: C40 family peptidase [Candidatus Kapaibacteriota bacterium]
MIRTQNTSNKYTIILLLIISLLIFNSTDLSAAKKKTSKKSHKTKSLSHKSRHYNPSSTKKMSLDILRQNQELAELANLNPLDPDTLDVTVDQNNQIIGEYGEDIQELEKEDNFVYDAENFQMLLLSMADDEYTVAGISKSVLLNEAMTLFGTPYRFGGITTRGLDCSAFTRLIYYRVAGIALPRTAREQISYGKPIKKISDLQFGDLIFFHTYSRKFASHVGIYLNDGLFVHAGTRFGVAVASLTSEYYTKRFIGGRRLTEKDIRNLKVNKEETTVLKAAM